MAVGVTSTSTIGANLLVVVDDVVANDDIQQKLMGITAETYGFGIRFFTVEKPLTSSAKLHHIRRYSWFAVHRKQYVNWWKGE